MSDPFKVTNSVLIEEQSLRDGLQSEARLLSLAEKFAIVGLLVAAGVRHLQIGSLVDPRRVPQMAGTEELATQVQATWPEMICSALVLNERGLDRALGCGFRHLSMSVSVADGHSRSNAGCGATAALRNMTVLVRKAAHAGIAVRAGLQCAFGHQHQQDVAVETVVAAARSLAEAGASVINLADTAGLATPDQVKQLVVRVAEAVRHIPIALHLHDTRGRGLANLLAGYQSGIRQFDTAVGGLGGCPFIAEAAGNVATEEAVQLLSGIGAATGIDQPGLMRVVDRLAELLGKQLPKQGGGDFRPAEQCWRPGG